MAELDFIHTIVTKTPRGVLISHLLDSQRAILEGDAYYLFDGNFAPVVILFRGSFTDAELKRYVHEACNVYKSHNLVLRTFRRVPADQQTKPVKSLKDGKND